jgi:hypothetical protein
LATIGFISAGPASAAPATVGTSPGLAGYTASATNLKSDKLTLRLTVPKLNCSKQPNGSLTLVASIEGSSHGSDSASGMLLFADCIGKTPNYDVETLIDDEEATSMPVATGDVLSISVMVAKSGQSVTVTDVTTSQTISGTGSGLTPGEIAVFANTPVPSGGEPSFPPFTKPISYSSVKVNGAALSTLDPNGFSSVDGSNTVMVQTSALNPAGTGFTLTYVTNT